MIGTFGSLGKDYGAAKGTVDKALDVLRQEGAVVTIDNRARLNTLNTPVEALEQIAFGPYVFHLDRGELRQGEEIIHLTDRERDVLSLRYLAGADYDTIAGHYEARFHDELREKRTREGLDPNPLAIIVSGSIEALSITSALTCCSWAVSRRARAAAGCRPRAPPARPSRRRRPAARRTAFPGRRGTGSASGRCGSRGSG